LQAIAATVTIFAVRMAAAPSLGDNFFSVAHPRTVCARPTFPSDTIALLLSGARGLLSNWPLSVS
jgi:hypothetical protein